jgi:hypothetical protein
MKGEVHDDRANVRGAADDARRESEAGKTAGSRRKTKKTELATVICINSN